MKNNETYKLDKSKKVSALDPPRVGIGIFLIIFCSVFIGVGIYGLVDFIVFRNWDWEYFAGFVVPLFFATGGSIAVVCSAIFLARQLKKRKIIQQTVKNGHTLIATISNYKCIEITHRTSDSQNTSYKVTFNYSYNSLENESVTRTFDETLEYRPQLFEGSKIMIGIDGKNVVIFDSFSLQPDSQKILDEKASSETALNFKGLSKKKLNIDPASVKYTAEFSQTRFWGGIVSSIFFIATFCFITIPFLIIFDEPIIILIFCIVISIIFIPFISLSVYFLVDGIKSKRKEQRILADCNFASANVNIPAGVFTLNQQQYPTFCFIDYKGKKRSYKIKGWTARRLINRKTCGVAAYTDTEAILLLYDYKFK